MLVEHILHAQMSEYESKLRGENYSFENVNHSAIAVEKKKD